MPNNVTLPSSTAFYITDITVPVSWYTVEAGRHATIYVKINGADYAPSTCTLPERNYNTTTLAASLYDLMNVHYPIASPDGTRPKRLVPHTNLVTNTRRIYNNSHPLELFADAQVVALMYMGLHTAQIPVCSVNDWLHNAVRHIIPK